jgi:hypothetical protein
MSKVPFVASCTQALIRGLRRQPTLLLQVLLIVGVTAIGYWRVSSAAAPGEPNSADLFMHSIALDDGELGWNQLCPSVQSQLPRDVLVQHTTGTRSSHAAEGLTLSIEFVGERPRLEGGTFRFYVATARTPDGSTGQKTYVIMTQSSGCVEDVQ